MLKQIIVDFQRENLHWQEKYQLLLEELNLYRRKRFGRSAEPLPQQGEVFNEAEVEAHRPEAATSDDEACETESSDNNDSITDDAVPDVTVPSPAKKRRPRLPPPICHARKSLFASR